LSRDQIHVEGFRIKKKEKERTELLQESQGEREKISPLLRLFQVQRKVYPEKRGVSSHLRQKNDQKRVEKEQSTNFYCWTKQ